MPLSHILFQDNLPMEIGKSLIDIYQSVFCVPEYFSIYHDVTKPHALAIYSERPEPDHVVFYSISGKEALVLNQLFKIDSPHLEYFVKFLFANYPGLHTIHVNKFQSDLESFTYPFKIWGISQDNVLALPGTMADYRLKLGKSTRANLSKYYNKLRREHDDFTFNVTTKEDIDQTVIRNIIALHRSRMLAKKSSSAIDCELEENIIQLSGKYGIAGTITIHDRLAAGAICYVVGNHCYGEVLAHDPAFNRYGISRINIYLFIEALIERAVNFFHMGLGKAEYKLKMGCEIQNLYHVSFFRTEFYKVSGLIKHVGKHRIIKEYKNMITYNYLKPIKEILKSKFKTG